MTEDNKPRPDLAKKIRASDLPIDVKEKVANMMEAGPESITTETMVNFLKAFGKHRDKLNKKKRMN